MKIEIEIKNGRRIYKIDVGDMPSERIAEYLERVKEEFNQKRIKRD